MIAIFVLLVPAAVALGIRLHGQRVPLWLDVLSVLGVIFVVVSAFFGGVSVEHHQQFIRIG